MLTGLGTIALTGAAARLIGRPTPAIAQASTEESRSRGIAPSICVFDVNETLLDIESMTPMFKRLFGDGKVVREWFNQLILYSDAISLSGPYTTFFTLGQGVLKMLGSIHNVHIADSDVDELRTRLLTMPAHPDVSPGMKQLKDAGFRLVTFTNSPPDPQSNPLKNAGIDGWFEKSLSVDRVRRFKPAAQGYHMVAEELQVQPAALCMIAAHTWDTIGAQCVGYSAALIARPGNAPLDVPGLPLPDAVAPDLPGVASQLIKLWR
jgi:2-haloacid dehalogenase